MKTVELYEFMIARCSPENLDEAYVKYSDYKEATERIKVLEDALPPPERLELLAEWFDKCYNGPNKGGTEVQRDLRTWAKRIRAALEVK